MLPIPRTSKVKHLEEYVSAVNIRLTDGKFAFLYSAGGDNDERIVGN